MSSEARALVRPSGTSAPVMGTPLLERTFEVPKIPAAYTSD
jgi:hypothetical protein